MSAVLVEELAGTPVATRPRWRHVPQVRGPLARPSHPGAPGGRPAVAAGPLVRGRVSEPKPAPEPIAIALAEGLQLTRRGLAVAVTLFLGVVAAGVLTLVAGFLAVSNAPVVPQAPSVAVQAG